MNSVLEGELVVALVWAFVDLIIQIDHNGYFERSSPLDGRRHRLHAEEDAQKASIKILFPLVIFVLPSMIAVIIGPAMISVLHTLSGN